ncbi:U3 small nucleolar RNA-associated protein 10-domain-containing protein [Gongronella butleri]|nr:U3 small nucleolar RNA-associated protein 10-domain-containing protein [Gongronella butleri]
MDNMALSLKQQLKKLGTADLKGVTETSRKYKASFLFSAKEAADQDMETIFSLARNGFLELINVEPDFAPFEAPLFSENAKAINRVLMSKQENDKLDETLNGFLAQLSPYFLLNAAGKTLEWLIRRFDIHKLNVESILACVLPYHETKPFVKMVSLLDIADNSSWVFLKPIRASSLPLSRELLVERIGKSRFVLDFVCKTVVRSHVGFSTLYTFYAATLVRFIASSRTVSSEMAIALTPYLVDGLQAREQPELQLATYMILSQLSSKTAFNSQAIEALTATLVQHARSSGLFRHAVLALIHLAQTQANFAMGDKAANALIDDAHFQATLLKHAANYAIDRFVAFLIPHFVRHRQFELLDTLVFSGYLASDNIQAVCRAVMDAYMQVGKQDATEFLDLARPLLVTISQRHVEQLDAVLDQSLQAAKDDKAASKALYALSNATLQGTRHQLVEDANTTLYLCLHHPSAHMRLLGIKKLEDVLASSDALNESSDLIEAGLLNSLCEFGESASYVLTKMPEALLAHVPMNAVLDCLLARLQEPGAYEHVCAVQTMVFLLNKAMSQADDDAVLRISRMVALFVFYSGSEAVLSVVQQTKSAKVGNNVVGRMVAHMRTASKNKKESLAYDWVSLEASDAANVDFWASMLTSTSRLDRVVAMVVLGARVAASHQSKDALLLLQGIVDRYASHPLLYTQAMDYENDKNHVLSMAAVNALRTIDVSESQEIQLVQLTLWYMIHQVQDASDAWIQACFDLVVGGPSLGCFEPAVAALLAGHLDADLLPFLATQWMEQENHVVKARSLQIGAAYIRAYGLQHAINDFQHLVPALLPCLTHGNGLVRAMAMACFKSIAAAYGSSGLPAMPALYDQKSRDVGKKKPKTSTLAASKIYKDSTVADTRAADISHFVDHMAHFDDEISSDGAYASRALALYYAQGQQHTSKAMRDTTTHVIHFLLAHINASRVVAHQIALLSLLQPLHVGDMLDRVIDLLEATLVAPSPNAQTTRLIVALVACYTPGSLAQGKNLDVFLRLLRNPSALEGEDDQGWRVSTRRQALHQITPDFFAACDQKIQRRLFHLLLDIATNGEQHDVRLAKHILLHVALPVTLIDAYLTSTAKMLIGTDDDASTQKGRKRTKNS